MIYNSLATIEELAGLAFSGCRMKEFLDAAEDVIINPLSFTPFSAPGDTICSKSHPAPPDFLDLKEEEARAKDMYVMGRMAELKDEPVVTRGGPGILRGHILAWSMEQGLSCGLVCIEETKIPLGSIDLGLVKFISRCTAHIYTLGQLKQKPLSSADAFDRLLGGQISGEFQLAALSRDLANRNGKPAALAVLRFPENRVKQVGVFLRDRFRQAFRACLCSWNGEDFRALIDAERYGMGRDSPAVREIKQIGTIFHCPVCISPVYSAILKTREIYERICALPFFRPESEALIFLEDYPESALILKSGLNAAQLGDLATDLYKAMEEYDRKNNTEYVKTISAYLDCCCSIPKTARKLNLHSNSAVYRINKARDLFSLDFSREGEVFGFQFSRRMKMYEG
jgi:hypothetical protein